MTDQTAPLPAWQDGDPLMEAIAAAVYAHCEVQHGSGIVTDDPRNIAAAAVAGIRDAARQAAGPRQDATVDELAYALDNATPYPIELDMAVCRVMAARLLEVLTVAPRPEHHVWQPEPTPETTSPAPMDPAVIFGSNHLTGCQHPTPAVGQPAAPAEAHPPRERWRVEYLRTVDPTPWWDFDRPDYDTRERAVAEIEHRRGSSVERRLVRETTTWTVDAAGAES